MSEPVRDIDGWLVEADAESASATLPGRAFAFLDSDGISVNSDDRDLQVPLPVLAAMLRAVGWRVEEPK